jgi:L-lactate dehydrogenase complex protein LldG
MVGKASEKSHQVIMSRDTIFARIHQATDAIAAKAPYPAYDAAVTCSKPRLAGTDPWEIFSRNFTAVNGRPIASLDKLIAFLKENKRPRGYCDPALFEAVGSFLAHAGLEVETTYERERLDDYEFGITRATGAIAESGSVILDDDLTSHRLAALSPWVHIAVLTRPEIHLTIPQALAALGGSPNIIWATGPSKTADVEGILIEGVHGPGEQVAFLLDG